MPDIRQEPLYYRGETGEIGDAVFAATIGVREQEIVTEASTELKITPSKASVKERLVFDVRYEPTSELTIHVPADLVVEYALNGEVVDALPSSESSDDQELATRKIVLSSPRQGRLELTAEYTVAHRSEAFDFLALCHPFGRAGGHNLCRPCSRSDSGKRNRDLARSRQSMASTH